MSVVALVPRRSDGGHRDGLWSWVRDRWEREHPDIPIFEGHHDEGPFNRSAAINRAAAAAGDWSVAVILDSDSFAAPGSVTAAVDLADRTDRITLGFDHYRYLSHRYTNLVMGGFVGDWMPGVEFTMRDTCSSCVVVSRRLWDEAGGFDEGFRGWGWEDVAFSLTCQALTGPIQRVSGDLWHLWHPVPIRPDDSPELAANTAHAQPYIDAKGDPNVIRALVAARRVPV